MFLYHDGHALTVMHDGQARCYPAKWLSPEVPGVFSQLKAKRFASLMAFCQERKPRAICCYRTYALGDVLMLIPVLRVLRRTLSMSRPILLMTSHGIHDTLGGMAGDPDVRLGRALGVKNYGADVHMNLDHCLEIDHRGGPESNMHRVELYARTIGIL